jgi:hypothetical protein
MTRGEKKWLLAEVDRLLSRGGTTSDQGDRVATDHRKQKFS